MTYFFQNDKGRTVYVDVSYFDAINGGSGQIRMKMEDVIQWLKDNPGYLIRVIKDVT